MTTLRKKLNVARILKVAELLKVIGHPVRLQILELLDRNEPLCVSEIQSMLKQEIEQSMLSHHLIKMKDKGILLSEKQGMSVYYRLADRQLLKIFDCMETCTLV